jgi:hypothetical protein
VRWGTDTTIVISIMEWIPIEIGPASESRLPQRPRYIWVGTRRQCGTLKASKMLSGRLNRAVEPGDGFGVGRFGAMGPPPGERLAGKERHGNDDLLWIHYR